MGALFRGGPEKQEMREPSATPTLVNATDLWASVGRQLADVVLEDAARAPGRATMLSDDRSSGCKQMALQTVNNK